MSAHSYESASRVLDAAVAGRTVPGFEAVGRLLADLGRTKPVEPGVALGSTAVAAATRVTRYGLRFAAVKAGVTAKSVIVVAAITLGGVVFLTTRGSAPATLVDGNIVTGGDDRGAEFVIDDRGKSKSTYDDSRGPHHPAVRSTKAADKARGPVTATTPTTETPSDAVGEGGGSPTPTVPDQPAPTTSPAPPTILDGSDPPEPRGNNGNGNGKGVGNGKGNQGNGGNGGRGNGGSGKP